MNQHSSELAKILNQPAILEDFGRNWYKQSRSMAEGDRADIEKSLSVLYYGAGLGCPQVFWCESPWQLIVAPVVWHIASGLSNCNQRDDRTSLTDDSAPEPVTRQPLEHFAYSLVENEWRRLWQRFCSFGTANEGAPNFPVQSDTNDLHYIKSPDNQKRSIPAIGCDVTSGTNSIWTSIILILEQSLHRKIGIDEFSMISKILKGSRMHHPPEVGHGWPLWLSFPRRIAGDNNQLRQDLRWQTAGGRQSGHRWGIIRRTVETALLHHNIEQQRATFAAGNNALVDQQIRGILEFMMAPPAPLEGETIESELVDQIDDELLTFIAATVGAVPEAIEQTTTTTTTTTTTEAVRSQSNSLRLALRERLAIFFGEALNGIEWSFPLEDWLPVHAFFGQRLGIHDPFESELIGAWRKLTEFRLPHLFYQHVCFICEEPTSMQTDTSGRLHSESGPAIEYADGYHLYSWHGTTVPAGVILEATEISIDSIEREINVEVRRVLIDRYGAERFLQESGAREVHRDASGVLYRKEFSNDEALVMVKVQNSTPEPDGSFKDYFLRVPPNMRTAQEAVAWTFNIAELDYNPTMES